MSGGKCGSQSVPACLPISPVNGSILLPNCEVIFFESTGDVFVRNISAEFLVLKIAGKIYLYRLLRKISEKV